MTNVSVIGPYFKLSKVLAMRSDLSAAAKLLYGILAEHRNSRTGQCNPKVATLAREIGLHRKSVHKALKELRTTGLIISKRGQSSSAYELPEMSQIGYIRCNQLGTSGCNHLGTSEAPASLYETNPIETTAPQPLWLRQKPLSRVMRFAIEINQERQQRKGVGA